MPGQVQGHPISCSRCSNSFRIPVMTGESRPDRIRREVEAVLRNGWTISAGHYICDRDHPGYDRRVDPSRICF